VRFVFHAFAYLSQVHFRSPEVVLTQLCGSFQHVTSSGRRVVDQPSRQYCVPVEREDVDDSLSAAVCDVLCTFFCDMASCGRRWIHGKVFPVLVVSYNVVNEK